MKHYHNRKNNIEEEAGHLYAMLKPYTVKTMVPILDHYIKTWHQYLHM